MSLLTVDELRARVPTSLADEVIEDLLDAAETAIEARYGVVGTTVIETHDGGFTFVTLRRRAATIDEISETYLDSDAVILDADDYRIRNDRRSLQRLDYGTHPSRAWAGLVAVEYTADDDTAERKRIQAELVKLDLNHVPGASAERLGDYSIGQSDDADWNYQVEREAILASLMPAEALDFA